jgi:hypothetical protein
VELETGSDTIAVSPQRLLQILGLGVGVPPGVLSTTDGGGAA